MSRYVIRLLGVEEDVLNDQAQLGHLHAVLGLATLAELRGDLDARAGYLANATDSGDPNTWLPAAKAALASGQTDRAMGWLRQAADYGFVEAADELHALAEKRADTKDSGFWSSRAQMLRQAEAWIQAVHSATTAADVEMLLRGAAGAGSAEATQRFADVLIRDDAPEAADWAERAAETGDYIRMNDWGSRLHLHGHTDEAEEWWSRARETAHGR